MKPLTVRADEVRKGDQLAGGGERVEAVAVDFDGGTAEIWTEADPMGPPALTLAPSDPVEVWR